MSFLAISKSFLMPKRLSAFSSRYVAKRRRAVRAPYVKRKKVRLARSRFARRVMSVVNRRSEVKECFREIAVNKVLTHNNVVNVTDNAFLTRLGTAGEDMEPGSGGARIGNEIFCKGIKVAINIEALQKRPQTSYWLYLVRHKLLPDTAIGASTQMFEGRSTTIPMDYIDTSKVDVIFCKKFVLRMPNQGTSLSQPATNPPGFVALAESGGTPEYKGVVTNPQHMSKFYVSVNKKLTFRDYDNNNGAHNIPNPGQRYQWVCIPYDNYVTPSSGSDSQIGSLHMTTVMKYTDV